MALTEKKLRFVGEYLIDGNSAQSAIRSGYSPAGANRAGWRLLQDPEVAAAIADAQAARAQRTQIDADWVLERLRRIADSNMLAYVALDADGAAHTDLRPVTRDQAYAISEILTEEYVEGHGPSAAQMKSVKLKLKDSLRALELIGKNLGMWKEKLEVDHRGGITVVLNGTDADL